MQKLALDSRNIFGTDGSGNQIKQWIDENHLVKVNSRYRESSKEADAYLLGSAMGLNCAKYTEKDVILHGESRKACITESFVMQNEIEITVSEIMEIMEIAIPMKISAVEYINRTVNAIAEFSSLDTESVYEWIYDMIVFDYIICNDDRHLTNFELLYHQHTKSYRFAPYYDHGQSFFRTDALLRKSEYEKLERKLKSKPFSTNPDKNIGDLFRARKSFEKMIQHVGGIEKIKMLGLKSGHLNTVLKRIERLNRILKT